MISKTQPGVEGAVAQVIACPAQMRGQTLKLGSLLRLEPNPEDIPNSIEGGVGWERQPPNKKYNTSLSIYPSNSQHITHCHEYSDCVLI